MKKEIFTALLLLFGYHAANAQCTASAGPDQTIDCINPQVVLEGSSNLPAATYAWSGPGGFTSTEQTPTVANPGLYTLTITDPSDGCTATASTSVFQDMAQPDISATGGTLTCSQLQVIITGSSQTPGVIFTWTGPNGFQVFQPNAVVSIPGFYTLMVVNPANGCTSFAQVVVTQDIVQPNVIATGGDMSCNSITLSAVASPPNVTYQWTGPGGFSSTTQNPQTNAPGTYIVVVTALNGCTSSAIAIVTGQQQQQAIVSDSRINPFCNKSNGSINLSPVPANANLSYQWTGPNNFSSTLSSISGLDSGLYVVTVTNLNSGCTAVYSYQLTRTYLPFQGYWFGEAICDDALIIETTGGTNTFNWGSGEITSSMQFTSIPLAPGTYSITMTDTEGCSEAKVIQIPPLVPPCTFIQGKIVHDENKDCQADVAETGFAAWIIKASGMSGTFYARSDSGGSYQLRITPGDYTVSLIPNNSGALVCQDNQAVSVPNTGDTGTADFLVQLPDPDCPRLSVNLSTPILRRCFSNNYYYLHYCNEGPVEVPDAYVTLELDPFLSFVATNAAETPIGNNTYRFDLGTLQPGFCGSFWVQVQVSCNAVLGQTHCSEAHIYPDTICDPVNPLWSGAQVEVKSECAGDSLHFILKNIGLGNMSQELEYIVIEDGIMLWQGAAPGLSAGEAMIVSVPANGATWRVEVEQEAFSPRPEQPVLSVEGCTSTGSFTTGFVNQFATGDQGQWSDINCRANVGSYDPNDKQGFPVGYGSNHYIRPGTELEYLIRFQNTGTDTAFTVVIRDTLDARFDPATVRPGASSHNYRFEMAGAGILIFDFQNILLPDSNVNEPASHGFVQFRVSPRADVPLETDVFNRAAIYFDFNDPIITNTVQHRYGENFVTVGIWNPRQPEYSVQVAPHPLAEASWLRVSGAPESGNYRLQVFDLSGRAVQEVVADTPQFLLKKGAMVPGMYLFRVERDGVMIGSGKLVVR